MSEIKVVIVCCFSDNALFISDNILLLLLSEIKVSGVRAEDAFASLSTFLGKFGQRPVNLGKIWVNW